MIKIASPNTESTSVEEKTEILETGKRKIDRTMIIMREISTTANEKIEGEEKNDGIGTVIREGATAKRGRKEEVERTNTAIENVGIAITRGKGPRRMRMIRDTGTGRTSIKENGEKEKETRDGEELKIL